MGEPVLNDTPSFNAPFVLFGCNNQETKLFELKRFSLGIGELLLYNTLIQCTLFYFKS